MELASDLVLVHLSDLLVWTETACKMRDRCSACTKHVLDILKLNA